MDMKQPTGQVGGNTCRVNSTVPRNRMTLKGNPYPGTPQKISVSGVMKAVKEHMGPVLGVTP